MLAFYFCPIYVYFLRITLSSSLPFVTHNRGHMARIPAPSPLSIIERALVFIARKKKSQN